MARSSFRTGTTFQNTQVGGLSSIAYAGGSTFYVLSDDQVNAWPPAPRADIADGALTPGDISFESVTILAEQPDGTPYPPASLDPEGFRAHQARQAGDRHQKASQPG